MLWAVGLHVLEHGESEESAPQSGEGKQRQRHRAFLGWKMQKQCGSVCGRKDGTGRGGEGILEVKGVTALLSYCLYYFGAGSAAETKSQNISECAAPSGQGTPVPGNVLQFSITGAEQGESLETPPWAPG